MRLRKSALTVVPFHDGSKQGVAALVDYICALLGMDLIPFASVLENRRQIHGLDDKSELAHRIMLVNLLRILDELISPLSPYDGLFGNDGLHSDAKISLDVTPALPSESCGEYLCSAGAVIGWTRGTGLIGPTNIVAHELESYVFKAQGTGVHIVMSAKTALELGCPFRRVLAFTSTSTDKARRSIPASGSGSLSRDRPLHNYCGHLDVRTKLLLLNLNQRKLH
ncbi:Fatty acid synthase [Mycena chlorophos]|uniref:Fatty acid synthase n=1 Tax=Mycena chlorophos TaxID=658473 RepID=A0A8H6WC22_MYCCL|nr:Fatty acid synthase [Mycena chlorophos]